MTQKHPNAIKRDMQELKSLLCFGAQHKPELQLELPEQGWATVCHNGA